VVGGARAAGRGVGVVLAAVAVASGCGGGTGSEGGDLEFTREDGTTAQLPETLRAWCEPFHEDAPDVEAVHVLAGDLRGEPAEPFWRLIAVRADAEREFTTTLPNNFVVTAPRGAALFVLDDAEHSYNELSSATEESIGTIDVELGGCEAGDSVQVTFEDVTLGSESSDLPTMSVDGTVEAEIGTPP
jgi:hypothetical protein